MKLYKLLKGIKCRVLGSQLLEIEGLYHNDKSVKKNGLYFCLNGLNYCGNDFIYSAINNGAVCVVTEKEIKGLKGVTQILVGNARKVMSLIAKNFYNNPAKNLKLIGVTGTNGKTSTTYMISDMLNQLGYLSALIGTNGVVFNDKVIETNMTTPDPIELEKIFSKLVEWGVQYVCMEISAHSIYLDKIEGLKFECVIFSNLTEDHLDYFETMDNYFNAKKKLFSNKYAKNCLINIDDVYGKNILKSINTPTKTYSIYNKSDYKADVLSFENFKQKFVFNGFAVKSKFLGEFNVYNLLSALACLDVIGVELLDIQKLVDGIKQIPGRFNTIVINKKLFIIDYAHTPDGLENVLNLCRKLVKDKKLLCIFGCGGNRETQKRAKMGEISTKIANFTIITTDNPRFEDRLKIAKEIESGVINKNYVIILDRKEAIKFANNNSNEGDIILIAGKGCEDYIDENGEKIKYSDFEEVENLRNKND